MCLSSTGDSAGIGSSTVRTCCRIGDGGVVQGGRGGPTVSETSIAARSIGMKLGASALGDDRRGGSHINGEVGAAA